MTIPEYIEKINTRYKSGISTEHSYRGDLQNLLESIAPDVMVTNEPTRVACGAPDYIITKRNIPIGYIEAKDLGADLINKNYKEQFDRYKKSLTNLIITNYLNFQLYRDGVIIASITLGQIQGNKIVAQESEFISFINLIKEFCTYVSQSIKSGSKLATMMAGKARLLENVIENALTSDEDNKEDSGLKEQLNAFKEILIHDITPKAFADIYAQTIAYGMFAARINDPTLQDFSRQEAAELIPKSNPFLRKLFQYIAGYDLDSRIIWIVDALADIFRATNVLEILKDFGKATQQQDPMIHFYETFLSEYDPKLRKKCGVYYTPGPVVNFIVRATDDILKEEFGIINGLADTSTVKIKVKDVSKATTDFRSKTKSILREEEVHKVQILDPAAGTGTFLAEIVKHIYKGFLSQQGIWSKYVDDHLIPRLNGFEILMASYAMTHLKLDLLLAETGYKPQKDQRFKVYLTNSLEEHHPDTGTLFANWLSTEANEANYIKRDTPVMVVLGNPPYSVSSSNKSTWIQNLIVDYKKDLNERKINLDDDYIKFIRFGQYFIDKNGEGVLAYISNNSFIDGLTHRQMRRTLLESFDKIYILDLHGSTKKNETTPEGTKDENVFDIQQGVSINIFIKTSSNKKFAEVYHKDIFGLREDKYKTLVNNNISSFIWSKIKNKEPYNFFVPVNYADEATYLKGFSINTLFINSNSGIQTKNDGLTINISRKRLEQIVADFEKLDENELKSKYSLKDTSGWSVKKAKKDLLTNKGAYYNIYYRPFDIRFIYMTEKSGGFVGRPRLDTMRHFFKGDNLGLITVRQQSTFDFQHVLISNTLMESGAISLQTKEWGYIYPLYIYSDNKNQQSFISGERTPNLKPEILKQISENIDLNFVPEKKDIEKTFSPIDILDYIYAVLHSPKYREKYKEFLKINFPRVPYPKEITTFWQLVKLGSQLRYLHLLNSPFTNDFITTYPVNGTNVVEKISYEDEKVWINNEQYFDKVPKVSWEFYIGGYQPAQKWLKDRKGRMLSYEDIMHYQKIIVALSETDRIMKEIDLIDFIEG